jgi:hypothetical protein
MCLTINEHALFKLKPPKYYIWAKEKSLPKRSRGHTYPYDDFNLSVSVHNMNPSRYKKHNMIVKMIKSITHAR